ncbi:unnamed protein product, partial [Discosporangium mesarthrocarpum]
MGIDMGMIMGVGSSSCAGPGAGGSIGGSSGGRSVTLSAKVHGQLTPSAEKELLSIRGLMELSSSSSDCEARGSLLSPGAAEAPKVALGRHHRRRRRPGIAVATDSALSLKALVAGSPCPLSPPMTGGGPGAETTHGSGGSLGSGGGSGFGSSQSTCPDTTGPLESSGEHQSSAVLA